MQGFDFNFKLFIRATISLFNNGGTLNNQQVKWSGIGKTFFVIKTLIL